MHIAAAMNTHIVAIFGPTDPRRTGPYGRNSTVVTSGDSCSPCLLRHCDSKKCMYNISPEQVLAVIEDKIGENRGKAHV